MRQTNPRACVTTTPAAQCGAHRGNTPTVTHSKQRMYSAEVYWAGVEQPSKDRDRVTQAEFPWHSKCSGTTVNRHLRNMQSSTMNMMQHADGNINVQRSHKS
jgi:hypothetical protein